MTMGRIRQHTEPNETKPYQYLLLDYMMAPNQIFSSNF
jgi:hypothetical protein